MKDECDDSIVGIWQAIERFRQQMNPADYPDNEDIFADVRDRSVGREVDL